MNPTTADIMKIVASTAKKRPTANPKAITPAVLAKAENRLAAATAETVRIEAATAATRQRIDELEQAAVEAAAWIDRNYPATSPAQVAAAAVRDAELVAIAARRERNMSMLSCGASLLKACGSRHDPIVVSPIY